MKEEDLRTREWRYCNKRAHCYCVTQNFVKDYVSNFDIGVTSYYVT
jgi:hypothetical protein